jgi:hypothetical protein
MVSRVKLYALLFLDLGFFATIFAAIHYTLLSSVGFQSVWVINALIAVFISFEATEIAKHYFSIIMLEDKESQEKAILERSFATKKGGPINPLKHFIAHVFISLAMITLMGGYTFLLYSFLSSAGKLELIDQRMNLVLVPCTILGVIIGLKKKRD